jgi:hypothetical protein
MHTKTIVFCYTKALQCPANTMHSPVAPQHHLTSCPSFSCRLICWVLAAAAVQDVLWPEHYSRHAGLAEPAEGL